MTTAVLPDNRQALSALKVANRIRIKQAAFKAEVRKLQRDEGLAMLAATLEAKAIPKELRSLRLAHFIGSVHRLGPSMVNQVLQRAHIRRSTANHHNLTLGSLTERERLSIAAELRRRIEVRATRG